MIFISGNPVLFSRSFCVTVKTRLDNYLGNLSNVATKDEKVAQSPGKQKGWPHTWVAAAMG